MSSSTALPTPNFFILGAPKCGTTSLAAWLGEHPSIYMSPAKEPHFFNDDDRHPGVSDPKRYEQLFSGAKTSHLAIGEASVWYLYSHAAVANIESYSRQARYLVCLRNPVEMAYSLHEQHVVNGIENVTSFEDAWHLSDARLRGDSVSRFCLEPRHLAYASTCQLGVQVERLLDRVDRTRVLPVLLDDVKLDPRGEYLKVLRFLNVEDDGRTNFGVSNAAKERRSPGLQKAVLLAGRLKRRLGIHQGLGILSHIETRNIRHRPRSPMAPGLRRELQEYFRLDIERLSRLIDRDLAHWVSD